MKNMSSLSGSNYHRICLKIALLEHFSAKQGRVAFGKLPRAVIGPSELDGLSQLEKYEIRMERLEGKVDRILESQLKLMGSPPDWVQKRDVVLLEAINSIGLQMEAALTDYSDLASDNGILQREIQDLAEGADAFLAGLQGKLTTSETALFFELIYAEKTISGSRRCRSYAEIGARLGKISKQAVGSRVKKLKFKHPDVWAYIQAIRVPEISVPFSGLSPSKRRKEGIDESYNYNAS